MQDDTRLHRQIGLFAGLLSSADGTWIPMGQLRRVSATAAWMLFFGFVGYAAIQAEVVAHLGVLEFALGAFLFAVASYAAFLVVGSVAFTSEN